MKIIISFLFNFTVIIKFQHKESVVPFSYLCHNYLVKNISY